MLVQRWRFPFASLVVLAYGSFRSWYPFCSGPSLALFHAFSLPDWPFFAIVHIGRCVLERDPLNRFPPLGGRLSVSSWIEEAYLPLLLLLMDGNKKANPHNLLFHSLMLLGHHCGSDLADKTDDLFQGGIGSIHQGVTGQQLTSSFSNTSLEKDLLTHCCL